MYTSSFVTSIQLLLKTTFLLHKVRVCPTAFWTTFAPVFVLINWLIEFPSSAVANRFELRCQLKQLLKADFQSVEFSERGEILLFAKENVALKLNR